VNSIASDMLEVWFELEPGSRYHICACITAPAPGLWAGRGQVAHQRALRSWAKTPSHEPGVPTPVSSPPRARGGTTQTKLVPLPHGFACRPLVP
jgi:hypothetical protein